MDHTTRSIAWLFAALGLVGFLATGYWVLETRRFLDRAAAAPGQVIDLAEKRSTSNGKTSVSWHPVVSFRSADGRERRFRSGAGSSPPSYRVGEAVTVLYDPAAPEADARIKAWFDLWGGQAICGVLAVLFGCAGGALLAYGGYRGSRAARLLHDGMAVTTTVKAVELNRAFTLHGAHPWQVVAEWRDPATGELRVFRSEHLWSDPTAELRGQTVRVYLDRGRPTRYHMDLSFLEELSAPTDGPGSPGSPVGA